MTHFTPCIATSPATRTERPEGLVKAPRTPRKGGSLGNTAKLPSPPPLRGAKERIVYPASVVESRLERFALQSVARTILPQSRTANCLRSRISGAPKVGVKYSPVRARASFCNLQTCGSVWACPSCSAKISEHRRAELVALVAAHQSTGGTVLLATRTFPHSMSTPLIDLLSCLKKAEDLYKSSARWKDIKDRFGIIGTVRAIEATFGVNGWHPHIHELLFLAPGQVDQAELKDKLFVRWLAAATRAGLAPPSREHGLDLRDGSQAAAYASKWGLEAEMTKWQVKRGKEASFSPFDLLRVALHDDDLQAVDQARKLFLDYATAFRGRRQLVHSRGLRELYLVAPEKTDEEAAKGQEPDAVLLGLIEPSHWKALCKTGLRGHLLEALNASGGDWSAIDEVLGEALARAGGGRTDGLARPPETAAEEA